jgi:hypothetical protein
MGNDGRIKLLPHAPPVTDCCPPKQTQMMEGGVVGPQLIRYAPDLENISYRVQKSTLPFLRSFLLYFFSPNVSY